MSIARDISDYTLILNLFFLLAVFDDYDEATIYAEYVDQQLLSEMTAMVHNVPSSLGNVQKESRKKRK